MTNFVVGDKVQIDPALVNGGARKSRGIGEVTAIEQGGTYVWVRWADGEDEQYYWSLVLVSNAADDHVVVEA